MKKSNESTLSAYKNHFDISFDEFQRILNISLSRGGDFAEIFLEYRIYDSINMEEDIIKETAENISLGLGIRVISGEKTGYGYTNELSFDKIKKVAKTASSIASGNIQRKARYPEPSYFPHNYYPISIAAHTAPLEKKISIIKKTYLAAKKYDQEIKKVKVSLTDQAQYITIVNSEGLFISDFRPLMKIVCFSIAEKEKKREYGFSGAGGRVGIEYFQEKINPEDLGKESAQEALDLLTAYPSPAGEMPVILAPGHSGVMIHEAVGHLLEADFIRKRTSIFWDKMNKKVGNSQINIYDDPNIPYFRGSYNIDDEGTIPKKTLLIEKGKVVGFLQDILSSKIMEMPLTGHGRRQDYSCLPIPRMSNTYIDEGNYSHEEIIKSVKKGFYACKYQGGQVEDSGKFTFSVNSGFLIEDGKLTAPVKQATLIGSNIDILNQIEMVGSDLKFSLQTGTCGKEGQSVPVTDGCPTIKIKRMTVGGSR